MLKGATGRYIPVYFLDTDVPENSRTTARSPAPSTPATPIERIKQEAILGIGGRRMLRAFTHDAACFHMNEGHAVFLTVELLSEHLARFDKSEIDYECIRHARRRCVFTTHTPIEAGHDRFPIDRVRAIIGDHPVFHRPDLYGSEGTLNTTILALNLSRFANGVARKHGEVSRAMFPHHTIDSITNGVHAASWTCPHIARLLDHHCPACSARSTPSVRLARGIADDELWDAHQQAKHDLLDTVEPLTHETFDPDVFTIGFARRATAYKRAAIAHQRPRPPPRHRLLRGPPADPLRRQGPSPTTARARPSSRRSTRPSPGSTTRPTSASLPAQLRHRPGPPARLGLRPLAQHARAAPRGLGHQRHESRPQRHPLLLDHGRLVDRGAASRARRAGASAMSPSSTLELLTGQKLGTAASESLFKLRHRGALPQARSTRSCPSTTGPATRGSTSRKSAISVNGSYFTTERMLRDYMMKAYDD